MSVFNGEIEIQCDCNWSHLQFVRYGTMKADVNMSIGLKTLLKNGSKIA